MIFKKFDWLLVVSVPLTCYLKIKPAACKVRRACRRTCTHAYGCRQCARGCWSSIIGFLTTLPLSHLEDKPDSLTHFCKYNRPSTLGKHDQKPSNTFSRFSDLVWPPIAAGMCAKVIYAVILKPKTTALTHHAYIYLETQTVEECITHADAALHL